MNVIIGEEIKKALNQLIMEVPFYEETLDLFTEKMRIVAKVIRLPVCDVIMLYFFRRIIWKNIK